MFLDRPEIAGGEALAGLLRAGNAGSNTAADHIRVLAQALAALPPAYRPDAENPDAPQVLIRSDAAGATALLDLSASLAGTRLILRKERPHPGAQLRFTGSDGHRVTGFLTDTPDGVIPGQLAGLELRHRQHARVPHPPSQSHRTCQPAFPLLPSQCGLAENRHGRNRSGCLDANLRLYR